MTKRIARMRSVLLDDRGDVPGWVLITLMTAGLPKPREIECHHELGHLRETKPRSGWSGCRR
jgi:hypothetical protein